MPLSKAYQCPITTWVDEPRQLGIYLTNDIKRYLSAYNLYAELKKDYPEIFLTLMSQQVGYLRADIANYLSLKQKTEALIRKTSLQTRKLPLTYATVIVPKVTYIQYKNKFDTLGEQLIGEHFLYELKQLTRSSFDYSVLAKGNAYFPPTELIKKEHVVARRSIFKLAGFPLVIIESLLAD